MTTTTLPFSKEQLQHLAMVAYNLGFADCLHKSDPAVFEKAHTDVAAMINGYYADSEAEPALTFEGVRDWLVKAGIKFDLSYSNALSQHTIYLKHTSTIYEFQSYDSRVAIRTGKGDIEYANFETALDRIKSNN